MQSATIRPQLAPGMVVALSLSPEGISELFLDNPTIAGEMDRANFRKYLAVVHSSKVYDPLGIVQDGLHKFSRAPPEEVVLTFLGPAGQLGTSNRIRLPFPGMTPHTKPMKLIAHNVFVSRSNTWKLSDKEYNTLQAMFLDDEAGAVSPRAPSILDEPSISTKLNLLIDIWTDLSVAQRILEPSGFEQEMWSTQSIIARCYETPTTTDSSVFSEGMDKDVCNAAAAAAVSRADKRRKRASAIGLGVVMTTGMIWLAYARRHR